MRKLLRQIQHARDLLTNVIDERMDKRARVYVDVQHGLGNRIRALISAKLLAEKSGRRLVVIWRPDMHCQAEFRDLFEDNNLDVRSDFTSNARARSDIYNYMDNEVGAEKGKRIDHHSPRDIYVKSAYVLNHQYSDFAAENEVLRRLVIRSEVLQTANESDVSNRVGIHVRMGGGKGYDQSPWNRPENWSQKGQEEMYYWRERSHFTVFFSEIDRRLSEDPSLQFFLATDREETYDAFRQRYGEKIAYARRQVFDRSIEQQRFALIDMVLLSRTRYILGSNWSSFTEIAHRLGNTPVFYSGVDFGAK